MAYFVKCDVKGCEATAECPILNKPDGWSAIGFDVDADEAATVVAAGGYDAGTTRVERRVVMCPDHPLPEFDPEPASSFHRLPRFS
jgi:hypothetical protein